MTDNGNDLSRSEIRREHAKLFYLAPSTLALAVAIDLLKEKLQTEPWHSVLLLLALGVAMVLEWRRFEGGAKVFLETRFQVFVLAYVLLFAVAANSRLLSWKSRITGFESGVRPNFLALNRLGDWHYRVARAEPMPGDLLVVTLEPGPPALARQLSAELIQTAQIHGATAVALDFDLTDPRPEVDRQFCRAVEAARKRERRGPMAVLYGRGHEVAGSTQLKEASSLPCLRPEDGGNLLAIREWDRRIRAIPLHFDRHSKWQALSFKLAGALRDLAPPEVDFVQFLEPDRLTVLELEEIKAEPGRLADKVVLAGFREVDSHQTPFGELSGVGIHASAAQALRSGELVRRGSSWISFPMIFAACYLLLALHLRRSSRRQTLARRRPVSPDRPGGGHGDALGAAVDRGELPDRGDLGIPPATVSTQAAPFSPPESGADKQFREPTVRTTESRSARARGFADRQEARRS